MTAAPIHPEPQPNRPGSGTPVRSSRRDLLAWSLATSGMCLCSGAFRVFGSNPVGLTALSAVPLFPLEKIPRTLDAWKYVDETHLDPVTTRITGSTDHIIRTYYDDMTGTTLSVLVLYGPAEPVLPHTPQVCYPASGYKNLGDQGNRTIKVNDQLSATFRAGLYGKSGGRAMVRQSVYHSYRLDGVWSPDVTDRSLPRRWAGIFKVQIQRRVLDGERTDSDEPIDSFLRQLLPALEKLIANAEAKPAPTGTDARSPQTKATRP